MAELFGDLLSIADELYGLPLSEFTPARDARAKELKGSDLAGPVKAPWPAFDRGLGRQPAGPPRDRETGRAGAGGRDRATEAQASMSGELRSLTRQRRPSFTAAVTTQARRTARRRVTDAVADQVEATLTAAMVDERCARGAQRMLVAARDDHRAGPGRRGSSVRPGGPRLSPRPPARPRRHAQSSTWCRTPRRTRRRSLPRRLLAAAEIRPGGGRRASYDGARGGGDDLGPAGCRSRPRSTSCAVASPSSGSAAEEGRRRPVGRRGRPHRDRGGGPGGDQGTSDAAAAALEKLRG